MTDVLRVVRFAPYLRGKGPTFQLTLVHTGMVGEYGKDRIAYTLTMREPGKRAVTVFEGDDLYMHVREDDASDAVRCCMGFLTLREGDVESDYFERHGYGPLQLAYRDAHAEALSCCVLDMFGED
jgi:hypothetical protein